MALAGDRAGDLPQAFAARPAGPQVTLSEQCRHKHESEEIAQLQSSFQHCIFSPGNLAISWAAIQSLLCPGLMGISRDGKVQAALKTE